MEGHFSGTLAIDLGNTNTVVAFQVQENINIVADWLEAGCIIQIDAGSPIGLLGKKAKITSEILIKNNWFQLIGSDAHDNKNQKKRH